MTEVLRWRDCAQTELREILSGYGLSIQTIELEQSIPGSYWGDDEAGLIQNEVFVRPDTPVHSLLHEACHAICMGEQRRSELHTDAGGDDPEENAVCYLQILLAEKISGFGRARCCADMDAWGYSFRLGSAAAWFAQDAEDAREWLEQRQLMPSAA